MPKPRRRSPLRIALVVVLALGLVAGGWWLWPGPVRAAGPVTGDPGLVAALGDLSGYHRLSVAVVELGPDSSGGRPRVRYADVGADEHTPYEAGSVTKALDGLVIADQVERGELSLDTTAGSALPLGDSAAGRATVRQLVTHSSGLPSLDRGTLVRALLTSWTGVNPYGRPDADVVLAKAAGTSSGEPTYAYSNLGAAVAGQLAADCADLSYPDLMQQRLFTPLGLDETRLQTDHALVEDGRSEHGRRMQPWVQRGWAPAGAVVTTSSDLARLAGALLDGSAPGVSAMDPIADTDEPDTRIGLFWHVTSRDGHTVAWHNGQTGGYHAYLAVDRGRGRAVVVLADVASDRVDDLGRRLAFGP